MKKLAKNACRKDVNSLGKEFLIMARNFAMLSHTLCLIDICWIIPKFLLVLEYLYPYETVFVSASLSIIIPIPTHTQTYIMAICSIFCIYVCIYVCVFNHA